MKVLILSQDSDIFKPGSRAYQEVIKCSEYVEELHVIVLNRRKERHLPLQISPKSFIYPTNSRFRLFFLWDILKVAESQTLWQSKLIADIICAQNSFITSLGAYLLSRKYRRNYIVDIYDSGWLNKDRNIFIKTLENRLLGRIFERSAGIRVTSQIYGEIISANNRQLEKKIFILPFVNTSVEKDDSLGSKSRVDIRQRFSQFNIILLAARSLMSVKDLKKLRDIISRLRLRYSRIGLVVNTRVRNRFWHPFFTSFLPKYILVDKIPDQNLFNYKNVNVFIDVSSDSIESNNIIYAIHAGYPVVASNSAENENIIRNGENGFTADPRNLDLFAGRVAEILETPGLREIMHLYQYDITDLYGTNEDDYYKRLINIWVQCKTSEADLNVPVETVRDESPDIEFYSAFTLNLAKKALTKFTQNREKKRLSLPYYEREEMLDIGSIKLGIKEALAEIEADKNFVSEPFRQTEDLGDGIKII